MATIGIATYRAADKKHKMLAAIPIIFAVQQAFEGFQWISLGVGKPSMIAAYSFLFFAFLFWPVYMPYTIFKLDPKRRKILKWLVGFGIAVALIFLLSLLYLPLSVYPRGGSICYDINVPFSQLLVAFYVFVTCGVLLFSSNKVFNWFGVLLLLSAVISEIFFFYTFTSVWCFFAAMLSSLVYFYIRHLKMY
ncbi:MAG: hypothetical protein HY225_01975 [Candidatus Vogelbacteria bacterium]|nr:hypothetical protein [Candidatus Vogelbacteria bacterium]